MVAPAQFDPHAHERTIVAGTPLEKACAAIVLLHGRGGSAQDILAVYEHLKLPGLAALAPQAAQRTWYPQSFLAPLEANQPWLDSALRRVGAVVAEINAAGIAKPRIALLGFSQGACLALEFAARHPARYGAVIAFTGGLIGSTLASYRGSFEATPVFLGTSDPDPHVPLERVEQSAEILRRMHARVQLAAYKNMPHTINQEELIIARNMLAHVVLNRDLAGSLFHGSA